MDQGDAVDLMQLARSAAGIAEARGEKKRFPKKETLHDIYSRHINTERPVPQILGEEYPQFVEYEQQVTRVFADYTARKAQRNLVDYDDLLLFWALMAKQIGRAHV